MFLEPLGTIPLVYQLTDPFDSGTYYVRSVVKDSKTGTILDSTNLTSQGSGRYTGSIVAPQDPTGFGRHIDVVTSVYTDAGYSTYSENYGLKVDNYIVKKTQSSSFGGSGGADVDYDKIRKIITEVVSKAIEGNKPQPVNLDSVTSRLDAIQASIDAIEMPEMKEPSLSPIINQIKDHTQSLALKIREIKDGQEKVDLSPVIDAISSTDSKINSVSKDMSDAFDQMINKVNKKLDEVMTAIKSKKDFVNDITKAKMIFQSIADHVKSFDVPEEKNTQRESVAKFFPKQ